MGQRQYFRAGNRFFSPCPFAPRRCPRPPTSEAEKKIHGTQRHEQEQVEFLDAGAQL